MLPRFPVYIPSKSRAEIATTPRVLDRLGVPYRLVVEESQLEEYGEHFPADRLLVLDPAYQRDYATLDELGDSRSRGPGPARNFIWQHSIDAGAPWHWVMDDNITLFARLHENKRVPVGDGSILHAMESFALRYSNVAMAGPNYWMFAPSRDKRAPFRVGTRIYSCNLIRNDVPFRWRGRYNEDTILSLDLLKAGWNTVLFDAFLQYKIPTQTMPGGNTEAFYAREGTLAKSQMLVDAHPDLARLVTRYGRPHHYVNYNQFRHRPLVRREDWAPDSEPSYEMTVVEAPTSWKKENGSKPRQGSHHAKLASGHQKGP